MIKAFLFDYDGVMTAGVTDGIPARRLAENLGIPARIAGGYITAMWDEYSTGKMTDEEAWVLIEAQHGQPISPVQRDIWYTWDEMKPLPQMVELVRSLISQNYVVGLLSNVLPVTAEIIREHGAYDLFDFTILSYEAGARKPDRLIYEAALAKLPGLAPDEVLFLDDREKCIIGAQAVGMHAFHVTDHQQAIRRVREYL